VGLVLVILLAYNRVRYRVHILGRPPREGERLLVVANHAHDLEGMVIPTALVRYRGIRRPVISAGSARIFEPGFMTERIPGRWARYTARWNVGGIVRLLGVRPIEDHPLSRPLASWAYLVFKHCGNVELTRVFDPVHLPPALPSAGRLSTAWHPRYVRAMRQEATISALTPDVRQWVRSHLRRQIEDDLAVFLDLLDKGYAVYTTPEGRFTVDGRLNRFRASLASMREKAGRVVVAGVSYDVLCPGKLAMWVEFEQPRWPDRLDWSVVVARPLTAAHLVIQARLAQPHIPSEDVIRGAKALLDDVEGKAVIVEEVLKNPDRTLHTALAELARRSGLGDQLTDERFPFVEDFVSYYHNQWLELMAVLKESQC
jgi:hypothetical protein